MKIWKKIKGQVRRLMSRRGRNERPDGVNSPLSDPVPDDEEEQREREDSEPRATGAAQRSSRRAEKEMKVNMEKAGDEHQAEMDDGAGPSGYTGVEMEEEAEEGPFDPFGLLNKEEEEESSDWAQDFAGGLTTSTANIDSEDEAKLQSHFGWINCKNLKEIKVLAKSAKQKTKLMADKTSDQLVVVQSQYGWRYPVLKEINILRKLKDNQFLLKFNSYSHTPNPWNEKFHLFYEPWEGSSLATRRPNFYKTTDLRKIFHQIGEALQHIHLKGIIHRNITPDSILVDDQLNVKIVDFSYAVCGPTSIEPHESGRKKKFDAPEYVAAKGKIDTRYSYGVDYYGVGSSLYYCKFGGPPKFMVFAPWNPSTPGPREYAVRYPEPLEPDLDNLITALLNPVPELRLGGKQYMKHPFFGKEPEPKKEEICDGQRSCYPYSTENHILVKTLHRGGFGKVKALWDQSRDRIVVEKLYKKKALQNYPAAVLTEINTMKLLSGRTPFIEIISSSFDTQSNEHRLLMDFFDGRSLESMKAKGIGSVRDIQKIMRQACSALQFVHAEGIIHRDVRPANILVNNQRDVKVIGFTSAILGPEAVGLCGTYGFIAPEVIEHEFAYFAKPYSYEADYFSLGATLYQLCYLGALGELQPSSWRIVTMEKKKKAWRKGLVYYPDDPIVPQLLLSFLEALLMKDRNLRPNDENIMDQAFLQYKFPPPIPKFEVIDSPARARSREISSLPPIRPNLFGSSATTGTPSAFPFETTALNTSLQLLSLLLEDSPSEN